MSKQPNPYVGLVKTGVYSKTPGPIHIHVCEDCSGYKGTSECPDCWGAGEFEDENCDCGVCEQIREQLDGCGVPMRPSRG